MRKKDKRALNKEAPKVWPWPPLNLPPGGGNWNPTEGNRDVAVLCPPDKLTKTGRVTKLLVLEVPDLDGVYVLSSDGMTRPFGEGH